LCLSESQIHLPPAPDDSAEIYKRIGFECGVLNSEWGIRNQIVATKTLRLEE
jgi:hypothetical protein